jgi:hypothetical protein
LASFLVVEVVGFLLATVVLEVRLKEKVFRQEAEAEAEAARAEPEYHRVPHREEERLNIRNSISYFISFVRSALNWQAINQL